MEAKRNRELRELRNLDSTRSEPNTTAVVPLSLDAGTSRATASVWEGGFVGYCSFPCPKTEWEWQFTLVCLDPLL